VVVNDSIVLVDFINRRIRDGLPLYEAVEEAGSRRFRPILLTSLTTIAGLGPILKETSYQAQYIIPMVATLVFGVAGATILVLLLVPACYGIYWRWTQRSPSVSSSPKVDSPAPGPVEMPSQLAPVSAHAD
jgi:multidrug efflux pump subunit AcrB